jgi:hypothetical protein
LNDEKKTPDVLDSLSLMFWLGVLVVVVLVSGWVIQSHFEAAAFNRVTGKHVSTWDAMWIELRVQEGPVR